MVAQSPPDQSSAAAPQSSEVLLAQPVAVAQQSAKTQLCQHRMVTDSPAGTRQLARALAAFLRAGDLVLLFGDLGAGKTTLVQGLVAALGVSEPVTSPTFALAHHYQADPAGLAASVRQVRHLDLYRLADAGELLDYVVEELAQAVVLVEWGEPLAQAFPDSRLELAIKFGSAPDARLIELAGYGSRWSQVWDQLALAAAGLEEPASS